MNESDSIIREYYGLKPTQFSILLSLEINQGILNNGICEQSLSIILANANDLEGQKLHLSFSGVRNFVFNQPDWSEISIGHLEIISKNDMPSISGRYLVRDTEQEQTIYFECNDFIAQIECFGD